MKKKVLISMLAMLALLTSCSSATPGPDEEAVLIYKSRIWGHGGIDPNPVSTGHVYIAPSTDVIYVKIVPIAHEEQFGNIVSSDKIELNYTSYLTLKVKKGQSPKLIENYGEDWYVNSIQKKYRDIVRNTLSNFKYHELMGERDGVKKADSLIMHNIMEYITELSNVNEFPVEVIGVSAGHIMQSENMTDEMKNTSNEIQRAETLLRALKNTETEILLMEQKARAKEIYTRTAGCSFDQALRNDMINVINEKDDVQIILSSEGNTSMLVNPSK